jgi:HNH endonuclease
MAITSQTRKILWARSGNECARCQLALVEPDEASISKPTVIGQECHIVARSPTGPRGGKAAEIEIDCYGNLILLCPNCHVLVDSRPELFSRAELLRVKVEHEQNVARRSTPPKPLRMVYQDRFDDLKFHYMPTGDMLIGALESALSFSHGHPPDLSSAQRQLLGDFFQEAAEWGDAHDVVGPKGRFEAADRLHQLIEELRELGLFVYAAERRMKLTGGLAAEPYDWRHAVIYVFHEADILEGRRAPVAA